MTPRRRKAIARRRQKRRVSRHVVEWFIVATAKAVAASDELAIELSRTTGSPEEVFERIAEKISCLPHHQKAFLWETIKKVKECGHEDT